jgi:hypothetical protein
LTRGREGGAISMALSLLHGSGEPSAGAGAGKEGAAEAAPQPKGDKTLQII